MAAEVPRDAHNLLQAINLQIESINVDQHSTNDEVHALNQQLAELQAWKREIEANPSSATLKRAAEEPTDEPIAKRRKPGPIMSECSTCMEESPIRDVAKLKCCNTRYCKTCFQAWFTAALDTKQLPKCCDVGIEPKRYPSFLTVVVKKKYKQVTAELDAERKIWCANPACGVVIKINDASGFVQCTKCRRKTCATCWRGTSAHKGRKKVCPNHLEDEDFKAAIKKNGLKQCPRCHVAVEKKDGCNNITCTCGGKFCYVCGFSKKTERDKCKCSHPNIQHEEPVEDPVSGEEEMATNDQYEGIEYNARGARRLTLIPGPAGGRRRSRAFYEVGPQLLEDTRGDLEMTEADVDGEAIFEAAIDERRAVEDDTGELRVTDWD
ncbi:hypothetical protein LTR70_004639 [Exophiala xenobiotica]|uniref:RBR-type E3 ubiquitin transferase n=1 Tax=Lithohypha guttulata TaxID=1690604 RepID=A0ABR0KCN6_9EURO|nr:hypothetical protein LTR24_004241 [Lithohypha guttulata]KAK5320276.1 hypothetical protein LTR70_004639 [Exophiala xenobiotica]